jgi:hypothetical protein
MRKLFVGLLLAGLSAPMFAFDDDHRNNGDYRDDRDNREYRNDRQDNGKHKGWYKKRDRNNRDNEGYNGGYRPYGNTGGYGNNGPYSPYGNTGGYGNSRDGRYGTSAVDRTMSDLSRIGSRGYTDSHESNHVNNAIQNLQEFNNRYRQGTFDSSRLDRAIDEMKHLANAQQLNPNDRQMIARDIEELRSFRSSGGGYVTSTNPY